MDILNKIKAADKEIRSFQVSEKSDVENFRLKFVSRKGVITDLFEEFKLISGENKRETGRLLNELKNLAESRFRELAAKFVQTTTGTGITETDITLPPVPNTLGSIHPVSSTRFRIIEIFERIGFNVSDGPEIEDDWHNFTALNFPENHPAREMQDTFFIRKDPDVALRTHTSSVQIRVMENQKPPIRTLAPGRVYRNEAISARAHVFFHQVEGLYVDRNVSMADLKNTLYYFAREMFGKDTTVRFRPSYFPFTEPSAEIDISCFLCHGTGCPICKYSGWVEIGGAGMVDPNVFINCKIDPEEFTGFAFGMGIDRIAMLKYQINDIRLLSENDIRFLRQFSGTF
ncbi:MAG TPA: phenylalanine--tRNA ligase subunit alpha [Cyclobacteriaceae bacterium]|nr:phenylalanine--tRNA ligase subunit alpha [Cyclobacteriaceae bacterium]